MDFHKDNAKILKKHMESTLNMKFSSKNFKEFLETIVQEEINRLRNLGYVINDMHFEGKKPEYKESFLCHLYAGKIYSISMDYISKRKTFFQSIAITYAKTEINRRESYHIYPSFKLNFVENFLNEVKKEKEPYILNDALNILSCYALYDVFSEKEKRIRDNDYVRGLRAYFSYLNEVDLAQKNRFKERIIEMINTSKKIKYVDSKIRLLEIVERLL